MAASLCVLILTHNEDKHILRAIASVREIASEIYVIDSFSTDSTREIAEEAGATVVSHPFVNYSQQFQWALENIEIASAWTMRLDADEVVESDLVDEIRDRLDALPAHVTGINLKRKHIFFNRWVQHGGRYPLILLRIWRTGSARIEDRWMDEHMMLSGGSSVIFHGGFADQNLNDLTYFVDKHNKYATREAIDIINQRLGLFPRHDLITVRSTSFQASLKRWVKEGVYNKMPFPVSSTLYFLWRYLIQLGFLDGKSGLIYHFLQAYWYRFLVGAKVYELECSILHLSSKREILAELSRLTGHKLHELPD
jgi:glycosyltransferase involved in cell wall biosynthesis